MKLTMNKEFLRRHLFAIAVLAGMGGWFGYDGIVTYPKTPATALYKSIESAEPPPSMTAAQLEAFKAEKTGRQIEFCAILILAAFAVGAHLFAVSRLDFAFDESGFTWRGKRYAYGNVKRVDRSKWAKKGIVKLELADGAVTLDSWHHAGVVEFEKNVPNTCN